MLTYCSFIQVKWDGRDDPTNPHNWPTLFRWAVTIVTSCRGFITMMSGSMAAPALPAPSHDLHMSEASAQSTLSIFELAFEFGPMLLTPFTELYGRRPVWLICGVFYCVEHRFWVFSQQGYLGRIPTSVWFWEECGFCGKLCNELC